MAQPIELILVRHLASSLALPTFLVDGEGTLVFYNEAAEPLLGHRFDEEGAMAFDDWTAAYAVRDDSGRLVGVDEIPLVRALRGRRPVHVRVDITGQDGAARTLEVSAFPLVGQGEAAAGSSRALLGVGGRGRVGRCASDSGAPADRSRARGRTRCATAATPPASRFAPSRPSSCSTPAPASVRWASSSATSAAGSTFCSATCTSTTAGPWLLRAVLPGRRRAPRLGSAVDHRRPGRAAVALPLAAAVPGPAARPRLACRCCTTCPASRSRSAMPSCTGSRSSIPAHGRIPDRGRVRLGCVPAGSRAGARSADLPAGAGLDVRP